MFAQYLLLIRMTTSKLIDRLHGTVCCRLCYKWVGESGSECRCKCKWGMDCLISAVCDCFSQRVSCKKCKSNVCFFFDVIKPVYSV